MQTCQVASLPVCQCTWGDKSKWVGDRAGGGRQWCSAPAKDHAVQPCSLYMHRSQQAAALHLHFQCRCLPTVFWPHMLYVMTALVTHRSGCHAAWDCGRGESRNVIREMRCRVSCQGFSYMNQSIKCHRSQFQSLSLKASKTDCFII